MHLTLKMSHALAQALRLVSRFLLGANLLTLATFSAKTCDNFRDVSGERLRTLGMIEIHQNLFPPRRSELIPIFSRPRELT